MLPGRVVYINEASSRSSYGRYLVIEHKDIGVTYYSLYAFTFCWQACSWVHCERRSAYCRIGRTAGGYTIPERAHLHFELGLVSDNFQRDMIRKISTQRIGIQIGTVWISLGLILSIYKAVQAGSIHSFAEYLNQLKARGKYKFGSWMPGFSWKFKVLKVILCKILRYRGILPFQSMGSNL